MNDEIKNCKKWDLLAYQLKVTFRDADLIRGVRGVLIIDEMNFNREFVEIKYLFSVNNYSKIYENDFYFFNKDVFDIRKPTIDDYLFLCEQLGASKEMCKKWKPIIHSIMKKVEKLS